MNKIVIKNKPLVSVIIPVYNRKTFIVEAVESVLNQTYNKLELIIVDDGSDDCTYSKIKDKYLYLQDQVKIRYFYQRNRGVSAARNVGIRESKGEYIAFLDSDDLWHRDKLEKQLEYLSLNKEYSVSYTNEIWIRRGKRVNPKKIHSKYSGWIYKKCLPLCIISPSSIILNREVIEVIGLFDENLPACEDYDYWLRLTAKYPIYYHEEALITKRGGHNEQLSQKYPVMDGFRIYAIDKIIQSGILSDDNYRVSVDELLYKAKIVEQGARKRSRLAEANKYQEIIKYYSDK